MSVIAKACVTHCGLTSSGFSVLASLCNLRMYFHFNSKKRPSLLSNSLLKSLKGETASVRPFFLPPRPSALHLASPARKVKQRRVLCALCGGRVRDYSLGLDCPQLSGF